MLFRSTEVHKSPFLDLQKELGVENGQFYTWDIMARPFEPEADRLISFEVIEHLPGEEGVANYSKSLKMGGIAAISVPNKWWIFETHGAKLPLLPWNRVPFLGGCLGLCMRDGRMREPIRNNEFANCWHRMDLKF